MKKQFGYRCEHCEGVVRPKRIKREAFKHAEGFVILENIVVGVCDQCANRYYTAETLLRVRELATGKAPAERFDAVPVAHAR